MDRHAALAMTFIVEISSLLRGSSPTRQSTYGSPRCARDDDGLQPLLLILQKLIFFLLLLRGDPDEAIPFYSPRHCEEASTKQSIHAFSYLGSPRCARDEVVVETLSLQGEEEQRSWCWKGKQRSARSAAHQALG